MSARNTWLSLLCLAFSATSLGAGDDLDEVVVQGDRHRLLEMRKEIVKLEDEFYERFNELSTDNQFDFYCTDKARTGTVIRKKICRPRFVADAEGEEGRASLASILGETTAFTNPARIIVDIKNKELQRLLIELVQKDPELRNTLVRYGDLKVEYTTLLTGKPQPPLNTSTAGKP